MHEQTCSQLELICKFKLRIIAITIALCFETCAQCFNQGVLQYNNKPVSPGEVNARKKEKAPKMTSCNWNKEVHLVRPLIALLVLVINITVSAEYAILDLVCDAAFACARSSRRSDGNYTCARGRSIKFELGARIVLHLAEAHAHATASDILNQRTSVT